MMRAERKILLMLIGVLLMVGVVGCGASRLATSGNGTEMQAGYEIRIRCVDNNNPVGKLMQVFLEAGIVVTRMAQQEMSFDRYELVFNVKCGSGQQINEAESQLRTVVNVESMVVRRV
jgi:(p)ppGpp synthase/HD superfamily hydrolase